MLSWHPASWDPRHRLQPHRRMHKTTGQPCGVDVDPAIRSRGSTGPRLGPWRCPKRARTCPLRLQVLALARLGKFSAAC